MGAVLRKPCQGVINVIRFNWHYYIIAAVLVLVLSTSSAAFNKTAFWICVIVAISISATTFISLFVSYYVYDRSDLYHFAWVKKIINQSPQSVVNIHAGFDETSVILKKNFETARLYVFDFYNPDKHTEVSIERARRAYAHFKGTIAINTNKLPLPPSSADIMFNIFALHEIRDRDERILFLKQQVGVLKDEGRCVIVEHLRDVANFLAYNVGFVHFFSAKEWVENCSAAGLVVEQRFKITPFITVFILQKSHGIAP